MSLRAVAIGLALGLFVSVCTLFNDGVIQGSWFIGNHLPVSVFGVVVALLLAVNPLLGRLGARAPLRAAEVAVIAAIGLAACGWPSFSFFWGFVPNIATPEHWIKSNPAWQATGVMSYVPGADAAMGHGHVQDWPGLTAALADAGDDDSVVAQVWRQLQPHERELIAAIDDRTPWDGHIADALLAGLNRIIVEGDLQSPWDADVEALQLHDRPWRNRHLLTEAFAGKLLPAPRGQGVLLGASEDAERARTMILQGADAADDPARGPIPWRAWWPALRVWGGLGLALGLAALCLALIVHPQWSRRELLIYPLAQFVSELGRRLPDRTLPQIATNRLFWVGFAVAVTIHGLNGLARWFPDTAFVSIPLTLNFGRLSQLFPNAQRVPGIEELFWPYLYLSVIGFAFLLNTTVSFSVGIAFSVYVAVSAAMLARGMPVELDYLGPTSHSLLRFGAYLGMACIIMYVGRRYYAQLAMRAVGAGAIHADRTPTYAVWAVRGLVVCIMLAVATLRSAGLDWVLSSLFVLLVLLMFLVMTRIVAETGLFFVQSWWMPVAVLTGVFGVETIGPTSYIVLAMASIMIVGDPRTTLMPYLANGLQIVERADGAAARRGIAWPLLTMLLLGFVASGLVTLTLLHDRSIHVLDGWSSQTLPSLPFDELARHLAHMRSRLTLADATAHDGLRSLRGLSLSPQVCGWIGAGVGLITLCSIARLRLAWWPIHPVLFLIWGTMPSSRLAVSFLLGWFIKWAVLQTGGTRGYRAVLPLMLGVIAGELIAALGWTIIGGAYYFGTGIRPPSYRVYP